MPADSSVALFYNVMPENHDFIENHLAQGNKLIILDLNHTLKKNQYVRGLIDAGRAEWVICQFREEAEGRAIDFVDAYLEDFKFLAPFIDALESLIGKVAAKDVFRKIICPQVAHCFVIDDVISSAVKEGYRNAIVYNGGTLSETLEVIKTVDGGLKYFTIVEHTRSISQTFKAWLLNFAFFIGLVSKIFLILLFRFVPKSRKPFQANHIFYINQPGLLDYKGYRGFDFMLDEQQFSNENSLFITPFSIKPSPETERKGARFIQLVSFFNFHLILNSRIYSKQISQFSKFIFKSARLLFGNNAFMRCLLSSANSWLDWHLITCRSSFKNFIYSNSDGYQQNVINQVLRQNGIKSWHYALFLGGRYMYATSEKELSRNRNYIWAFQNMDYYVGVNETVGAAYKLHKQRDVKYLAIGNIYSDLVRLAAAETNRSDFFRSFFHKTFNESYKIICVFDVACIDDETIPVTFDDALMFYQDILQLVKEIENYFIIFKPQKNDAFYIDPDCEWSSLKKGSEVLAARNKLSEHERVHNVGLEADTCQLMGVSDLVITQCASSPNVEALGAGKRSFWYESRPRRQGFLFDQIPKLRIDGYENLKYRSNELLSYSNQELDDYIRSVKPLLLSDTDGKALERFKKLIRAENAANNTI
tara:strand:+ start:46107 stop:48047 length:1941 start_codon:yes stop_codon:yes gene_type:complete